MLESNSVEKTRKNRKFWSESDFFHFYNCCKQLIECRFMKILLATTFSSVFTPENSFEVQLYKDFSCSCLQAAVVIQAVPWICFSRICSLVLLSRSWLLNCSLTSTVQKVTKNPKYQNVPSKSLESASSCLSNLLLTASLHWSFLLEGRGIFSKSKRIKISERKQEKQLLSHFSWNTSW